MTGHDDLIDDDLMDSVRRARPHEPLSARTPAAQALLEEILSMHVTRTPQVEAEVEVEDIPATGPRGPRRSPRRRLALVGAAAAALALTVLVVGTDEPTSAATVEAALAKSSSVLDRSGRAEITWRTKWDADEMPIETGVASWEFSGNDSSVTIDYRVDGLDFSCIDGDPTRCDAEKPVNRYVDGEQYYYLEGRDGTYLWYRDTSSDSRPQFTLDPSTLLDELRPAGGFEEIGTERVDGVETTRFQATAPRRTPLPDLDIGIVGDTITSLEVWVDHDGLVRRLDVATTDVDPATGDAAVDTSSVSIRFSDLGAPITIEAPPDAEDISPDA